MYERKRAEERLQAIICGGGLSLFLLFVNVCMHLSGC